MSFDHTPSRGDERMRIESAGGFIQYDRLMGKCMLSRCLGQFEYKVKYVLYSPHKITKTNSKESLNHF